MSIRFLEPAQTELDEAIAWYADQAPGLSTESQAIGGVGLVEPQNPAATVATQIDSCLRLSMKRQRPVSS